MHELTLLQDLSIVMTVSAVITILFHRLHLPVVLGYILAGVIIGPHTPPFPLITDVHSIQTLSELGIIFLLFAIGLEFSFGKLAKVGFVAIFAATVEIVLMMAIGYFLGRGFGWNFMDSLFLGAILSISSTTIIVKVLMDMKKVNEKFAQVILGILIIEDLLAIVIIAILSGLAISGTLTLEVAAQSMLQVGAFIAGVLLLGFWLIPKLLNYLEKLAIPEMFIISILGLCFAASLIASKMGFSVALGAFLIGAIIADTKQGSKVIHQIEPIKDMFTAVFFVSVGMLIQPQVLVQYWLPVLVITVVTIIGKICACSLASFVAGYKSDIALKVGLGLAQIGEFSFIIARLGESTEVTSHFLYPIAVSISGITTLTTPFLMKNTAGIITAVKRVTPSPVATFLGLYTGWFQSFKNTEHTSESRQAMARRVNHYVTRMVLYVALGLIAYYTLKLFYQKYDGFSLKVFRIAAAAMLFPMVMGFLYSLDRLLWESLSYSIRKKQNDGGDAQDIGGVFQFFIRFLFVLAGVLVLLPLLWKALPSVPLMGAILLFIAVCGFLLWNKMARIHEKIERTVLSVFDRETVIEKEKEKQTHDQLAQLIREEYPWEVETADFLVPFKECGLNQRIRDLKLRGITGASIVAVYRGEESVPNPSPDWMIGEGDVLLLMGDSSQIKAAIEFLNQKIKEGRPGIKREGAPKTSSVRVTAGSTASGKTIKELKLRRKTGTTILGIQKGEVVFNNPEADVSIEEGDILFLFGWPDEIEAALQYFEAGA